MTTLNGADAAGHPTGAALKAANIGAFGIYLTGAFADTVAHILDLTNNGRWCWAIFEVKANAAAGGAAQGTIDAESALAALKAHGIPKGAACYLTDDNSSVPYATVALYWTAAAKVVRAAGYRMGGYGPHGYCTQALAAKIIDSAFVAGGWENGQPETGIAIKQEVAQSSIGGVTCDLDQVLIPDAAGLFNAHGLYVVPAPTPKPLTADQYAALHGFVHVDIAEANLLIQHKLAWYVFQNQTMKPVTGRAMFGVKAQLDAAGIPHAGA
jgi:hypothetical protein